MKTILAGRDGRWIVEYSGSDGSYCHSDCLSEGPRETSISTISSYLARRTAIEPCREKGNPSPMRSQHRTGVVAKVDRPLAKNVFTVVI